MSRASEHVGSVRVTVTVAVDPATAFEVFTGGLELLPPDRAASVSRHSWRRLATWFEQHLDAGSRESAHPPT